MASIDTELTVDLANAQIWTVKAQGEVVRLNPMGDPTIEKYYHKSLEQGRFLEQNIGDAQHWLQQKKNQLQTHISVYMAAHQLAIDGQLPDTPRSIKYVKDAVNIIQQVTALQKEISGLIQAVLTNIAILEGMEQNMLAMVNQNLNSLSILLNQICNWGLPSLPSLPNRFPDTIFHWNGFNFTPLASFAKRLETLGMNLADFSVLNPNFSFNQCSLNPPNTTLPPVPSSITTYSGLNMGTALIIPPLGGVLASSGQSLTDPTFVSQMQNTSTPVYTPTSIGQAQAFNPNSSMQGAVPNPATIISNYQMPSDVYQSNIVSIVPSLTNQTIEPTDADYGNPNLAVRNPELQKALAHYVTLENVVASGYDPNLTSAWLLYLETTRNGRLGSWIENFQVAYVQYITPSITYLKANPVPWNCVLPSNEVNNTPTAIPLISTLKAADSATQNNILWKLSYLEASLLGYTRSQQWDDGADAGYLSSFTGTDLDYKATTLNSGTTTTLILGEKTADYPTPCTFPSSMGAVLQEVIDIASINIQNTPSYVSSRPQFNFIYNQFGEATQVNRFTQFWRTFNANLQALLLQDPYLIQFVVTYAGALDSAIDPLGNTSIYNQLAHDAATRNRSWVPGTPLLNIPVAPKVTYTTNTTPSNQQNGWQGTNFDPNTFLSRPDIQGLPIPTQLAMLRTNLSYAATQQMGQTISNSIQSSIQQNQTLIQDFTNVGFQVEVVSSPVTVPPGSAGVEVSFDTTNFDLTGYVTSTGTFTITTPGTYAVAFELNWGSGDSGARAAMLMLNGSTVLISTSTDSSTSAPTTIQGSVVQEFNAGDVLTVVAQHGLLTAQTIISGSNLSAVLSSTPANNQP